MRKETVTAAPWSQPSAGQVFSGTRLFLGLLLLLLLLLVEKTCSIHSATRKNPSISNIDSAPIITKPILFLHGVGGHATEFNDIIQFLHDKYGEEAPTMHSLDICEGVCSLHTPMPRQRDDLIKYLQDNSDALNITQGFHWVAHSQGSILARAVIQNGSAPQPNVFVSMAGPQMGQWGECVMNRTDIPEAIAKKMSRPMGWVFFYNAVAQRELSFANYWHDPAHVPRMIKEATLLPALNGYDSTIDMTRAKANFLSLDKAVFVGSEDDDCINPPLSSVFQFVHHNGTVRGLEESLEYQNDTFGLRTMMEQGRAVVQSYPGLEHLCWRKPQIFEKYVLPHLLAEEMESTS